MQTSPIHIKDRNLAKLKTEVTCFIGLSKVSNMTHSKNFK